MTIKEKLLQEFSCAIASVFAGSEEAEYTSETVFSTDIDALAYKVKFYMDLD